MISVDAAPEVYQGQFGEYTITESDRKGVKIYRASLALAALSFTIATTLALQPQISPISLNLITALHLVFCLALGVSLWTIHIYMAMLHRCLQLFWGIGTLASLIWIVQAPQTFPLEVFHEPRTLFSIAFLFAALTGIYFKEAFCFNRLETKILTPLVPVLILGHLFDLISLPTQQILLATWAVLFMIFALRKLFQNIPADIGDKSVFNYLAQQKSAL